MSTDSNQLQGTLADAVMDRPREFFIGNRRFCLWSPSLGMSIILSRHIDDLDINEAILKTDPTVEALRLATLHTDKVCHILAISTFRRFRELSNSKLIENRAKLFKSSLSPKELAQIFILILREPTAESLCDLCGLDKQKEEQARIIEIKKSGSSFSFGGLTIYGTLIGPAMSTLNMSYNEVVWGISLVNLKMLLADSINSFYLSDDEMKKIGSPSKIKKETYGMTPEDIAKLKAMDCWT